MSKHMSKSTPGPWKLKDEKTDEDLTEYSVYRERSHQYGYDTHICQITRQCHEDEANARLIAAAPDMLEALKSVCNYLDGFKGPFNHELLNLRHVIAKAGGNTT